MKVILVERAEWDLDLRAEFWEQLQTGLGREYLLHVFPEPEGFQESMG